MLATDVLDAMYSGRMLVFGHRGASAYAPMNTLSAFELAAEQGADGVELDVHRSADGHAVIVHDFTVDETTNGSGYVTEMTLAQLKALDAGSWKGTQFAGTRIPTLDEVFEAVGQRLYINVEIKSNRLNTDGVEALVAERIHYYGMEKRVIVSSFNPVSLRRFQAIAPDIPIGYLTAPDIPFYVSLMAFNLRYEAFHPFYESITQETIEKAKKGHYRVNTWTVNDPMKARLLRDMGIDAIITDTPDVMCDALAE